MQQDLIPFAFEDHLVRVFDRDGEPWFVLADVCRVLEIADTGTAARRLDDDEKGVHSMHTLGGPQGATIINESGLYSLVLTSRKPAAKRFKKWVTADVLPTLRRTGVYVMGAEAEDLPSLADGRLWGTRVAKVNAAARMLAVTDRLYGPEAARAMWEMEAGLPKISHFRPGILAGTAQDDPLGCFRHLMRQAAAPGRTVGKVLHLALSDKLAERMLPDFGLRLGTSQGPDMLAIANAHPFLAACYAETQWIGEWHIALASLPGAMGSTRPITFGKVQSRAVLVPRREIIELLHGSRSNLM